MANCCVWDFTIPSKDNDAKAIELLLLKHCKKWCFQEERGDTTGFNHFQGRVSFKTKKRLTSCKKIHKSAHWSPTSNANRDNCFYVLKEDTRIDGPWQDKETVDENYIPRQVKEMQVLYPWQQSIVDKATLWDKRTINVVIDKQGGKGKSSLMQYMTCHKLGKKIPYVNCHKDIMRMTYCIGISRCYLLDMPRAIDKTKLAGLYAGIEEIKGGWCYDDRYNFRQRHFDCPNIWLFTNKDPDLNLLSRDRWVLWCIKDNELVRYKIEDEMLMPEDTDTVSQPESTVSK